MQSVQFVSERKLLDYADVNETDSVCSSTDDLSIVCVCGKTIAIDSIKLKCNICNNLFCSECMNISDHLTLCTKCRPIVDSNEDIKANLILDNEINKFRSKKGINVK